MVGLFFCFFALAYAEGITLEPLILQHQNMGHNRCPGFSSNAGFRLVKINATDKKVPVEDRKLPSFESLERFADRLGTCVLPNR